ncbi:hypothetical protein AIS11_05180 [Salmonella enterica]|uniref:DUF5983 family protein n=1 Tax=Salmonella enterica TaxID=28901 RepID=UPI000DECE9A5|nr:DUF5983 family protein [Salmonella enterica]EDN4774325.1 hypothetical protein [Salmonella enterica subsp. enterica serovar Gafsa]EEH9713254.1 hypothetical protein [Salmonella enterica subsp. enterica serovar Vancouver]MIG81333.1 hypothetical protein [Salmonella enterica subsp. enterica]AXD50731.1 hypothetical protein CHD13_00460 [Salmonella enterica]EBC3696943.1 hypothetical protein [Salmonella enterica]
MKISLNVEADSINVLALNMGKIAVEVDGVDIETLLNVVNDNVVNDNGYKIRVADVPGPITVEDSLPAPARLTGIQCSTAHITDADNQLLYALSHQAEEYGDAEWVHYTGSGYLLRLDAWSFPVLRLKRLGLSKAARRLIITLIHRYSCSIIHFDAFGELLPEFDTFDW